MGLGDAGVVGSGVGPIQSQVSPKAITRPPPPMISPPNKTTVRLAVSYAMAGALLAGGLVGACCSVHVRPSHVHVSLKTPADAEPPNSTTVPVPSSGAIPAK